MTASRKSETVCFRLSGHYLEKLERRASVMNFDSPSLYAKHLTLNGLEESGMKEVAHRLSEVEKRFLDEMSEVKKRMADMVFIILYGACGLEKSCASEVAQGFLSGCIDLDMSH